MKNRSAYSTLVRALNYATILMTVMFNRILLGQDLSAVPAVEGLTVVAVSPEKNSAISESSPFITVTFSSPVLAATLTNSSFVVTGSLTGVHRGAIGTEAFGIKATFLPNTKFLYGERIQVVLTSSITAATNGAPLAGGYAWEFHTKTKYGTGNFVRDSNVVISVSSPAGIAGGDFNMDGFPDIAVTNSAKGTVSVLFNNAHGGFRPLQAFATGNVPKAVNAADFNNDGAIDLVVANTSSASISILLNTGAGVFGVATSVSLGSSPKFMNAADFDNDGDFDLAVTLPAANAVSVLKNDGSGILTVGQMIAISGAPSGIALGDLTNDGMIDAAVAIKNVNSVSILKNVAGSLHVDSTYALTSQTPVDLVVFDFDRNGTPDIAVVDSIGADARADISVLLNGFQGAPVGAFFLLPNTITGIGSHPVEILGNDYDADGSIDVAVACLNSSKVNVVLGRGLGIPDYYDVFVSVGSAGGTGIDIGGEYGGIDLVLCGTDGKLRIMRNPVTGTIAPAVTASTQAIHFGTVRDSVSTTVTLFSGVVPATVDSIGLGRLVPFTIQGSSTTLRSYDSVKITIVFKPHAGEMFRDTLRIYASATLTPVIHIPISGTGDPSLAADEPGNGVPTEIALRQNYPNPFNPTTNFEFRLPARTTQSGGAARTTQSGGPAREGTNGEGGKVDFGLVRLSVFDLLGREVAVLVNEEKRAGIYTVIWNASKFPSGVYLCTLTAFSPLSGRDIRITRKLVLTK